MGVLWGTGIGQFFFSIRKQHTVNKGTRVQGNGSEYFRGVVFSYSFSIYCAAYHGIWCSDGLKKQHIYIYMFPNSRQQVQFMGNHSYCLTCMGLKSEGIFQFN